MAFSKEYLYGLSDRRIAYFFKALGHPARIKIIRQLVKNGVLNVNQISKAHPIGRRTLSQHLRILRKAHLIECEECYPYTCYWVNEKNLAKAKKCCSGFFKETTKKSKR